MEDVLIVEWVLVSLMYLSLLFFSLIVSKYLRQAGSQRNIQVNIILFFIILAITIKITLKTTALTGIMRSGQEMKVYLINHSDKGDVAKDCYDISFILPAFFVFIALIVDSFKQIDTILQIKQV